MKFSISFVDKAESAGNTAIVLASAGHVPAGLQAVGMGESAPIDPANPDSDANRRVEFQALS